MRKRRLEYVRISSGGTAADLKRQRRACDRHLQENGRCGIYVRSSTSDGRALEMQEAEGIKLCRRNGWRFQVFREAGMPGAVLRKLVQAVKAGTINYVFVHGWDRLSRNLHQAMAVKDEIERGGARIVTSAGQAADAIIADVLVMFHRFERSCLAERRRVSARKERPQR